MLRLLQMSKDGNERALARGERSRSASCPRSHSRTSRVKGPNSLDPNTPSNQHKMPAPLRINARGRPHKAPAHAHEEPLAQYLGLWPPQPRGGRVLGRVLHRELQRRGDLRAVCGAARSRFRGGRGDCEAAGLVEAAHVHVEPLPRVELLERLPSQPAMSFWVSSASLASPWEW